jgi:hypothetical protein
MMNERRKSPRVEPPSEVIGTVKATVPARILDLSTRGAQVEIASALRPGASCNVSLPRPEDDGSAGELKLRARIQRCRARSFDASESGEGGMLYRAGLSFLDLSPDHLETLEELILDFSLSEREEGPGQEGGDGPIRIQIAPENVDTR